MPVTATVHPHRGRPRDPSRDRAILDASIELIAECGYDRMTVDAIAHRAGVSKPTIYRRWPGGKEELVAAAVAERRDDVHTPVDTGSLRGDLVGVVDQLVHGMREHHHLAAGLTHHLRESPELARLFRSEIVAQDRARFAEIVDRAVARGELSAPPAAAAATLLADLAPALVHSRWLITGEPLDAEQLVDLVLLPALEAAR